MVTVVPVRLVTDLLPVVTAVGAAMQGAAVFMSLDQENWFSNLHDDPRWLPFLERIGRSPAQLATIEFEVKLPE